MRLLLDTHIFVWYDSGDPRLRTDAASAINDPGNQIFLSIASIWEVVSKHRLGNFKLPGSPAEHLIGIRNQFGFVSVPIDEGSILEVAKLPLIHRDPFDRIIVAQAIQHGLTLVTDDPVLKTYRVTCL